MFVPAPLVDSSAQFGQNFTVEGLADEETVAEIDALLYLPGGNSIG